MRPSLLLALALLTTPLLALAPGSSAEAATLHVGPGQAYARIQHAVDDADPGDTVLVHPGVYQEEVLITTPRIVLRGVDRTSVVLDGGGLLNHGVTVVADGVSIESMTARKYAGNGFFFSHVTGFRMYDLFADDNEVYGLYAIHSTKGDIGYSYAQGHKDAGFYIGETTNCDCDVHHNEGWNNMLGYSGTANSYVRIWANDFHHNRAGILMSVLPNEMGFDTETNEVFGTQVHTKIYGNYIHDNNEHTEGSGVFEIVHPPVGEGITIGGGWFNEVYDNVLINNKLWGVGIFWLTTPPRGNVIGNNYIEGSRFGVWWDEWGEDHCFVEQTLVDVQVASDPADLPTCPGLVGDLPCPEDTVNLLACRASDVRAPSALKEAWLARRALLDLDPHED